MIVAIPFLWLLWNPVSSVAVAFFSVPPLVMGVVGLLDDVYSINEYVRVAVSLGYPVALYAVGLMPKMIYVPLIGRFSDALLVGAITVAPTSYSRTRSTCWTWLMEWFRSPCR